MSTEKLPKRKDIKAVLKQLQSDGLIGISVDCVIFGFDENELKVLMIKSDLKQYEDKWTLLGTWCTGTKIWTRRPTVY